MMRREIQRTEIMKVVFNLGPGCDVETQLAKNARGTFHGPRHRVNAAHIAVSTRQGDIHLFFKKPGIKGSGFQC